MRRAAVSTMAGVLLLIAMPAQAHTGQGTDVAWRYALPGNIFGCCWIDYPPTQCEAPYPPWSYADVLTAPAPAAPTGKITVLHVTMWNTVDHDLFLCANNASQTHLDVGVNHPGEPCDNLAGTNSYILVGCHEDAATPVVAGQRVILRAYNWLDAFPPTGRYWFTFV